MLTCEHGTSCQEKLTEISIPGLTLGAMDAIKIKKITKKKKPRSLDRAWSSLNPIPSKI